MPGVIAATPTIAVSKDPAEGFVYYFSEDGTSKQKDKLCFWNSQPRNVQGLKEQSSVSREEASGYGWDLDGFVYQVGEVSQFVPRSAW